MNAKVIKDFVENNGFANIYTAQKTSTGSGLTISVDFVPQMVILIPIDAYAIWFFPSRFANYGMIISTNASVANCIWGNHDFSTPTINSGITVGVTVFG